MKEKQPIKFVSDAVRAIGPYRLWIAGCILTLLATVVRLYSSFFHLILRADDSVPFDFGLRYIETNAWFGGDQVYGAIDTADYPPASYAIFWPFMGWLSLPDAQWLWTILSLIALAVTGRLLVRESGAKILSERLFFCLLPFSIYPTNSSVIVGQLPTHLLPVIAISLLTLERGKGRLSRDILSSALFIIALVKPQITAPFFLIMLFRPGRLRPAIMTVAGYLSLTIIAKMFQPSDWITLLKGWSGQRDQISWVWGHTSVYTWMKSAGLHDLALPASLLLLTGFAIWLWVHRKADFWILVGVTALISRLWIHHRVYDDLIVLLAMVPLFRLANSSESTDGERTTGYLLFFINWVIFIAPLGFVLATVHYPLIQLPARVFVATVWLTTLGYLASRSKR